MFKRFFAESQVKDEDLLGRWEFEKSEPAGSGFEGSAMEFEGNGKLTYASPTEGGTGLMVLTWRIEDAFLVTDQPSAPQENRTKFAFEGTDRLRLEYSGVTSWYARI